MSAAVDHESRARLLRALERLGNTPAEAERLSDALSHVDEWTAAVRDDERTVAALREQAAGLRRENRKPRARRLELEAVALEGQCRFVRLRLAYLRQIMDGLGDLSSVVI